MVSALDDPLLQKYIMLTDDPACQRRMDQWLDLFLDAQLQAERGGEQAGAELREVLEKVLSYARRTKVRTTILPSCQS